MARHAHCFSSGEYSCRRHAQRNDWIFADTALRAAPIVVRRASRKRAECRRRVA